MLDIEETWYFNTESLCTYHVLKHIHVHITLVKNLVKEERMKLPTKLKLKTLGQLLLFGHTNTTKNHFGSSWHLFNEEEPYAFHSNKSST